MPQLEGWLTLIHTEQLGPITFQKLLTWFKSPDKILSASTSELENAGAPKSVIDGLLKPNKEAIINDLKWLEHKSHHFISIHDADYPSQLKQISDPPIGLYVNGDLDHVPGLLSEPQLAIVGSRNASSNGKEIATRFASKLVRSGLVITSGLASGIDGCAHRGALQESTGTTIAVMACGLDRVYPAVHKGLAEKIAKCGLIISEFPIGTMPKPGHFPRRNRIISGLSLGVLVVEASLKSGSLITARLAGEQGREVFAVPGSINNPLSKGCHTLIRSGAKLVESVEDILEELKYLIDLNEDFEKPKDKLIDNGSNKDGLDPMHEKLLNCMGYEPISIDNLIQSSGIEVEAVSSILLILELKGYVSHNGNGVYVRSYQT